MSCLVSVIMPVYGVEEWLESAVRSVLMQTLRDFELILVDDASPDQCGALCDRLAQQDSRIRVIHCAQNGGLSQARNIGMDAAKGTYLFFMDSDDTIDAPLLEKSVQALSQSQADWLVFGATEEHYDEHGALHFTRPIVPQPCLCRTRAELADAVIGLEQQTLLGYAWNKLFRTDFIRQHHLRFERIELIEDILFCIECARHARSLIVLGECGYHYARRTQGSLTGRVIENYWPLSCRRIEALISLYEDWAALTPAVMAVLAGIYARYLLSALERLYDPRRSLNASKRRAWIRALKAQPLYMRLHPYFHGKMGIIARHPLLMRPAGWALHVMHRHFGALFRRLRAQSHKI